MTNRITQLILPMSLISISGVLAGCLETEETAEVTEVADLWTAASKQPGAAADREPGALTEVSPALFDLVVEWSQAGAAGVSARSSAPGLLAFVEDRDPALAVEAEEFLAPRLHSGDVQVETSGCACQLIATVDASPSQSTDEYEHHREMRDWPNRSKVKDEYRWTATAHGAAHRGELYRYHYHGLTGHERNRENHTQLRVHLLCQDATGLTCAGSCQGQMYLYAEYGGRYHADASTEGVWDKAAHVSAADGVVLSYTPPFGTAQRLIEKVGGVSQHANQTAFNIDEVANLVKNGLAIVLALETGGFEAIQPDLIADIIRSFAGLISREGTNGSTETEMFVSYDSTQAGAFTVSFSPSAAQVHTIKLATQAGVKNRGWGGQSWGTGRYATSYLLAAAFDYFQCDAHLTPPARGGISRYASTADAPYDTSTLAGMTQSFFQALGL